MAPPTGTVREGVYIDEKIDRRRQKGGPEADHAPAFRAVGQVRIQDDLPELASPGTVEAVGNGRKGRAVILDERGITNRQEENVGAIVIEGHRHESTQETSSNIPRAAIAH